MNIVWELNIADTDGSDFYFLIKEEEEQFKKLVDEYISVGSPVGDLWYIPLILKKEEKHNCDFFHMRYAEELSEIMGEDESNPEDATCISQRIYDKLYPLLKDKVEFLPMQSDDGIYYVMNVTNIVDCLDRENSVCNLAPNGLIINYDDLVFDGDKNHEQYIFRIPELPYNILLMQNMKELIEENEEISFGEDELVFDESFYILGE